jgi:hydrogenase expression/formation protein HypC
MCLAVPMRIESIAGDTATVDIGGTQRDVNVAFIEDPSIGEYVLVHAGFAIQKIGEEEAAETVRLLNKLAEHARKDQQS